MLVVHELHFKRTRIKCININIFVFNTWHFKLWNKFKYKWVFCKKKKKIGPHNKKPFNYLKGNVILKSPNTISVVWPKPVEFEKKLWKNICGILVVVVCYSGLWFFIPIQPAQAITVRAEHCSLMKSLFHT